MAGFTDEQRTEIREMIKEYVSQNLSVRVEEDYDYSNNVYIRVKILLEDEVVASDYVSMSRRD